MSLEAAIARNRERQIAKQYPVRLPLPRYAAWDVLSHAIDHIRTHGETTQVGVVEMGHGDWDATVMLMDARRELLTPVRFQ